MDQTLFSLINGVWTSPGLDRAMAILSDLQFWMPLLILAGAAIALAGNFCARAAVLVLALTVALTDGVVVNGLKHWANRPRPYQVEAARVVKLSNDHLKLVSAFCEPVITSPAPEHGIIAGRSFPSAHTANNFAVAAVLALFFTRWGWLYFAFAAAVGYSRIYNGCHWPSDVLISAFLGAAMGLFCTAAMEALWRRLAPRLAPRLHLSHPSLLHQK